MSQPDYDKLKNIRMLALDVDGVLTDGGIYLNDLGQETKRFFVRDGLGIRIAQKADIQIAAITGRVSRSVAMRLAELEIKLVRDGVKNKAEAIKALAELANVTLEEIAYVGDDLIDLPAMRLAGYSFAVADASGAVIEACDHVTTQRGGNGAVREVIEHLLKSQGKWDQIVDQYRNMT